MRDQMNRRCEKPDCDSAGRAAEEFRREQTARICCCFSFFTRNNDDRTQPSELTQSLGFHHKRKACADPVVPTTSMQITGSLATNILHEHLICLLIKCRDHKITGPRNLPETRFFQLPQGRAQSDRPIGAEIGKNARFPDIVPEYAADDEKK